jgi:demethylmenaquinone methyltransferase/2-methoxy-6-polyprenyl-1,4-benzoquinol methylase
MDHLKPGGKIIFHDFTYPTNKLVRRFWDIYFVLLYFARFFIPSWKEAFVSLPKIIRSSTWLSDYKKTMENNGLDVQQRFLTWNSSALLIGTK